MQSRRSHMNVSKSAIPECDAVGRGHQVTDLCSESESITTSHGSMLADVDFHEVREDPNQPGWGLRYQGFLNRYGFIKANELWKNATVHAEILKVEDFTIPGLAEIILANFNAWDSVVGSSARRELLRILNNPNVGNTDTYEFVFSLYPSTPVSFDRLPVYYAYCDGSDAKSPGRGEVVDYMIEESDHIFVLVAIGKPVFLVSTDSSPSVPEAADQSEDFSNNSKDRENLPGADKEQFDGIWIDSNDLKVLGMPKSRDAQSARHTICHRGRGRNHRLHHHHHSLSPFFQGRHVYYKALPRGYSFLDDNALSSREHGFGIVEKVEFIECEPGTLKVLVDVFHQVKLESCPGQVFDRVWFFPRDLGTIYSTNDDSQKTIIHSRLGHHGALPPHSKVSQESVFSVQAPPKKLLPLIVRHTTAAKAIGFTGQQFTKADKDKAVDLTDPNKIRRQKLFETVSQPLPDGKDYGFFISYRWLMGRFFLHASLIVQLNHWWSAVIACVSMFVILAIAGLVNTFADVHILPYHEVDRTWCFSVWWRALIMILGLFGLFQTFSRQRIFLDKLCIHQGNANLNRIALTYLPFILSRCKALLCVVDAVYFKRMWCVYEVAMFLKVRPGGNVLFVYHWQCVMFLVVFGFQTLARVIPNLWLAGMETLAFSSMVRNTRKSWVISNILLISQYVAMYVAGWMYFRNQRVLCELQKHFDVRKAQCGVPADIPFLLDSIKEQFVVDKIKEQQERGSSIDGDNGDDVAGEAALDKFNESVKKLLTQQILFRGWRILPYSMVLAAHLVLWWEYYYTSFDGQVTTVAQVDADYYGFWLLTKDRWPEPGVGVYLYLFSFPYRIFCLIPLVFYVQTLIIKFSFDIGEWLLARWGHARSNVMHMGIPVALATPAVLSMCVWQNFHFFVWDDIADQGLRCLLGAKSWRFEQRLFWSISEVVRFSPLENMFNCFGTRCGFDFQVEYTLGIQIVSLLLFLFSIVVVYFIHEPEFGARWRRFLWRKCVKGFNYMYYTICFSKGARRVSESESKTNASNSNRFTDLV